LIKALHGVLETEICGNHETQGSQNFGAAILLARP